MGQDIGVIAAVVTIVGGGGLIGILIGILKNKELIKSTLADWTRRGRKVIYIWAFHNQPGDVILYFYLCGEETSLFLSVNVSLDSDCLTIMVRVQPSLTHL